MAWILLATSASLLLSVLAAPVTELDAKNSSEIDPLLVPKTSKKFAEIFKYALEICGAFTPHQANELRDSILMLTDVLEAFPQIQDMERVLLEATAATIARTVVENAATDGGIFAKTSCVDQALKSAFELTTGKPDHAFIAEVEKMIEVFFLEDYQQGDSSYSYEGSYSDYFYDDYSDYFDDDYDSYSDDDYDSYSDDDYDSYFDGDYNSYFDDDDYEDYFESPGYFEDPGEMEYFEGTEPNPEDGFQREEYGPYEDIDPSFIEEPHVFFELVPVGLGVVEVPVEYY